MSQIHFNFQESLVTPIDMLAFEKSLWRQGMLLIAGVDEAGRGPFAGPVFAAAVILPPDCELPDVNDSKKLTPSRREEQFQVIQQQATGIGIGQADHHEIDQFNILQATFLAMKRAIDNLPITPDFVLIDGNQLPPIDYPQRAIVKGDQRSLSIAAASIIAKVTRDRLMLAYDQQWPEYGFARHKGYLTQSHRAAILKNGLCPIHRRSFRFRK
ncbi:ribonuclease HII [candidate division KSB1 bacterium]|nr:ribonuclease HII [candidate division KSB1 bacterium]